MFLFSIAAHSAEPSSTSASQTSHTPPQRMGLDDFYQAALDSGVALGESQGDLYGALADQELARAAAFPRIEAQSLFGPVPNASGNALASQTDWGRWNVFSRSHVEIIQPLYTFGAISSARKAAQAGVNAREHLLASEKLKLRSEVAKYYYGYQLAFELLQLANQIKGPLDQALAKEGLTAEQRRQLESAELEVSSRSLEAEQGQELARMAMAWKLGRFHEQEALRWDRANLRPLRYELGSLESYQQKARAQRPDWKALQEEREARQALLNSERAQGLPVIFGGAKAEHAVAPGREKVASLYANDRFNNAEAGVALGLKWDLSFQQRKAKRAKARAELMRAEARWRHLSDGIMADVQKKYSAYRLLNKQWSLLDERSQKTRREYRDAQSAIALGTLSGREFLETLKHHMFIEAQRLEKLYEMHMAHVELQEAVGGSL